MTAPGRPSRKTVLAIMTQPHSSPRNRLGRGLRWNPGYEAGDPDPVARPVTTEQAEGCTVPTAISDSDDDAESWAREMVRGLPPMSRADVEGLTFIRALIDDDPVMTEAAFA